MASSAKRRAVGLGENPQESEHSSDEDPEEEEEDSGEEDSEASEEEINEVTERSSLHVDSVHCTWPCQLASKLANSAVS